MNDEEKTVYLNNKDMQKQTKTEEETIYIGKGHAVDGEDITYRDKNNAIGDESTVYMGGKEAVKVSQTQENNTSPIETVQEDDVGALYYLPINTMLQKRYRIDSVLGEGGFGITYSGWDITLNIPVAVKEYYPSGLVTRNATLGKTTQVVPVSSAKYGTQFRDGIDRVLDEARRMAKFRNIQGIVGVYDFFEANSTAYIVMEYIDGCTLDVFYKYNRMDNITLFNMLVPVMDAIQLLHNEGILHRDISLDNIMVDHDGNFKLLDFGAARGYSEENLTTMSVILKKSYAPEEQFRSKGIQGPWTDVYALGVVIYELITGQVPPMSIERLAEDEIIDIRELAPSLTKGQSEAIMAALAVRSKDRWQSVDEFKNALLRPAAVALKGAETLQPNENNEAKKSGFHKDGIISKLNNAFRMRSVKYIGITGVLAVCILLAWMLGRPKGGKGTGYLGVTTIDIPSEVTQQYQIAEGAYITGVLAGTPAAEGNFAAGDIISALDSKDISSYDDFSDCISDYREGDIVKITFLHLSQGEYKEVTKKIKLADKNKQPPVNIVVSSIDDVPDTNVESDYEDLDIKFMGAEQDLSDYLTIYLAISNPNTEMREVCFKQLLINGVRLDNGRDIGEIKGESEMTVQIVVRYSSLLNSQVGDEMHELSIRYEYGDEEGAVRECIDSGFTFHLGDSNVIRSGGETLEENVPDTEPDEGTEMNNADDMDGTDGSKEGKGDVFNFDVPDYLDVKYVSCENRSGYITFFFNITNNGKESRYINFQPYGYIKGIDLGSSSEGKKEIDPGETVSLGCTFGWDEIGAIGFERINNVVFKLVVKENKDAEEYLDVFNQCIRLDEEEDKWEACSFDEIDNSDVDTAGAKSYSFGQQVFRVRYAGFLNRRGYITYYFQVANQGNLPLYCSFDAYQTVNGISIRSSSEGNKMIMPGTSSALDCTIDWDDVKNAGMEDVQDVIFNMYGKEDNDSEEINEFTYGITYAGEDYVANN